MAKFLEAAKAVMSLALYVLAVVLFISDQVGDATFLMAMAIYLEH